MNATPPGATVKSFDVREGVALVDLSASFLTGPNLNQDIESRATRSNASAAIAGDPALATAAIEKTLLALPEIETVRLTIEGRPLPETDHRSRPPY